ncbi:MAG TPA: sigma-70 family RNA polymerase sigma factor, partial [Solirubrobacteraceae bacterium]|nr:sigma-70 family RNA polymerase sigma factor [Solirubrobacteraceae bacterium]
MWPRFAPDDRLVALVRRGELTAFEILYDRHASELLAFCSYILDSRHDAEDAVQSTFASAYKALMADERPVELRPWLFAIARNTSLSILRTRRPTSEIHELPARGEDPALRAEQRESLRLLVATMLELPEHQRTALVLAELHGLSHGEIGTVLDVPSERVKAYIYQARSNLVSEHVARGTDCAEIRHELSGARGPALLKAKLRRHLRSCEGCRDFAAELSQRRGQLGILIPVAPTLALKRRVLDAASGNAGGAGAGGTALGASLAGTSAELAGVGMKTLVAKVLVGVVGAAGVAGAGIGAGVGTLALSAAATNGHDRGTYSEGADAPASADAAAALAAAASGEPVGAGSATPAQGGVASTAPGQSHKPPNIDRAPHAVAGAAVAGAAAHGKSAEAAGRVLGGGKGAEAHGKGAEAHGKSGEEHGKSAEAHGKQGLGSASGEAHRRGSSARGSTGAPGKSAEARGKATPHEAGGPPHGSDAATRQAPAASGSSGAAGGEAAVANGNAANAGNESHGAELRG